MVVGLLFFLSYCVGVFGYPAVNDDTGDLNIQDRKERRQWNTQDDSYLFNKYVLESFIFPPQWLNAGSKIGVKLIISSLRS